ncbi:hypothetical protein JC795_03755 [Pseudomonas veronii]|uniref:hypothetical protein n=1 Tax=Pseudomonas veronii TaxID=76761 RepID=UPI0018E71765|nr:hypothetical protein [Pseudomonas veronii]MBJ2177305.1 hypothetical protein [Pseudomonas veronii]
MESALIGIIGVIIGIIANELIRRKSRIENYAQKTFDKRLEIFNELYQRVSACGKVGQQLIADTELSLAERLEVVSGEVFEISDWCDLHGMYLEDEVTVHCVTLLMGLEDVQEMEDEEQRMERVNNFQEQLRYAKEMIKKESGIKDVNKSFTSMTKAKYSSPVIDYYRKQKKAMLKSKKITACH